MEPSIMQLVFAPNELQGKDAPCPCSSTVNVASGCTPEMVALVSTCLLRSI